MPAAGGGGRAADEPARDAGPDQPDPAADGGEPDDAGSEEPPHPGGTFVALTYNVAGLPEGLSSSDPERNTPLIGPLLNDYDLVFLQESWQTPETNPLAPLRVYHEILVAASTLPYKTAPAAQPLGNDPSRPTALLGDGLDVFSRYPLGDTRRVPWRSCVDSASDCLAFKGFSMTPAQLADGVMVHLYDLHMEAGDSAADDQARDAGIDQLLAFIQQYSSGTALIIGGDFNLHTDREPAAGQLARLLALGGLFDSCGELHCPAPGNIDKLLYRSSGSVSLQAESWELQSDKFETPEGGPLSDHEPLAVRFRWKSVN
jgi:endonuclease/exonuclease/phosphatase family metal-dependent hydrolase